MLKTSLKSLAVNPRNGWVITTKGKKHIHDLGIIDSTPAQNIKNELREHSAQINNADVKKFVEETITALEKGLLRSAIVLSWMGAISVLYKEVKNKHLDAFNREGKSRSGKKWKDVSNFDDLTRMKEYDFLQILFALPLIPKNVKYELESCLKLRNACSHPSALKIGEHKVASHIEIFPILKF